MTEAGQGVAFHGVSFNRDDKSTRAFTAADLGRELADPSVFSWIDLQGPDIGALNAILRRLDIDLVLVSHFDAPEVLPRTVERPDCLAFYLYEVVNPELHLDTSHGMTEIEFARMIMVLGADFVITYHRNELDAVEYVKSACDAAFKLVGKTPGFIAFLFMNRCLYDYGHLNLANDNSLDLLEATVLSGRAEELAEKVSICEANLLTLKKLTSSLQIVLMLTATKRSPFISSEARESFDHMLLAAKTVRDSIDSSSSLLRGVVNHLQASAAARTNEIARVLTMVSAIMLPLSFIASIYGMNFQHMPELKWEHGYYGALGLMGLVAAGIVFMFFRLGWIKRAKSTP